MFLLFPISTHKSFGLSTKPPLTLLVSWAITLNEGLGWNTPSDESENSSNIINRNDDDKVCYAFIAYIDDKE